MAMSLIGLHAISDIRLDFKPFATMTVSLIVDIGAGGMERTVPASEVPSPSVGTVPAAASIPGPATTIGRRFTSKQMGDACEMLVAAELTLAGIPALKVPDNWPHYDVIAQPVGTAAQRISVKSRTYKRGPAYVEYKDDDLFDWLAIVILSGELAGQRRVYIVPKLVADRHARQDKPTSKTAHLRYFRIDEVERLFSAYCGNFGLGAEPA
jgi:hypothetical protein